MNENVLWQMTFGPRDRICCTSFDTFFLRVYKVWILLQEKSRLTKQFSKFDVVKDKIKAENIFYASPLVVRNKEKMHIFLHNLTWFPLSRQIGLTWSAMLAGTLLAIVMMATSLCWKWLNFNCATLLSLLLIFINNMLKVSHIHGFSMKSFPLLFLTHQLHGRG